MDNSKFLVSSTPHIRSKDSIQSIMRDVLIALSPACIMGIAYFGIRALLIIVISIASCIFFEAVYQKSTKQAITIYDLSAVVTGLLLAMNMPASSPYWMPVVGGFFAIVVAKQLFGGLGQNFINPALAARAFLMASYPTQMTNFERTSGFLNISSVSIPDAVSSATPLSFLKGGEFLLNATDISSDILNAFIGRIGGCIGETCAIALILGGVYLLIRKVISWRIPVVYIGTVFILTAILRYAFNGGYSVAEILTGSFYELFVGGLMLGAFFMATDYSSSPVTPKGQIIMALGCGLITVLIRVYGGYPEGVSYSILLMNLAVPLIDRYTKPKLFGEVKKNA